MKSKRIIALAGASMIALGAGLAVAVNSAAQERAPVDAKTQPPLEARDTYLKEKYHSVVDKTGTIVGYAKNPALTAQHKVGMPDETPSTYTVFKNPDGSGGVVGYLADFGFIPRAQYEAPGFNLDAARAARRADIEAQARRENPNRPSIAEAEKNLRTKG